MGDGHDFDQLSRKLAGPVSRRGVLKAAGVALAGAVATTVLKPFRAEAALTQQECEVGLGPGVSACGDTCCARGQTCLDAANSRCSCPAGTQQCGSSCCRAACSSSGASCCCRTGQTPCGANCCDKGVACLDQSAGLCGCPPGKTPCGSGANLKCCAPGQSCAANAGCGPANAYGPCCKSYQAPCTAGQGNECCSGICASNKGDRCGCHDDSDCPRGAPHCSNDHICYPNP
jgi:hypothetical protein